jgi:hypothetical protein
VQREDLPLAATPLNPAIPFSFLSPIVSCMASQKRANRGKGQNADPRLDTPDHTVPGVASLVADPLPSTYWTMVMDREVQILRPN